MENIEFEARKQALAHAVHLATIVIGSSPAQKTSSEIVKDAECYLKFIMLDAAS